MRTGLLQYLQSILDIGNDRPFLSTARLHLSSVEHLSPQVGGTLLRARVTYIQMSKSYEISTRYELMIALALGLGLGFGFELMKH